MRFHHCGSILSRECVHCRKNEECYKSWVCADVDFNQSHFEYPFFRVNYNSSFGKKSWN